MLLNQIQDGTSFGVKEMSAKNSNVPTKSRTRAKTSFQALFLSVRATASDSNLKTASFNVCLRFHPCARHRRLITVAAHYGSLPSPGRPRCCARHASLLHVVRKTSARPDAGGPARTK